LSKYLICSFLTQFSAHSQGINFIIISLKQPWDFFS